MSQFSWRESVVLVTGGTGSFGRAFVDFLLREHKPRKLIVFSRDELKQHEMRQVYPDTHDSPMRYFIGDVRDRDRLNRAFHGVDVVVHTAALKQVPACEYNPFEAVKTNVIGAQNVIDIAIDQGAKRVLALSTDKAVNPVNLYGASKLCAEKLFIHGNSYSHRDGPRFACTRYGNVVGSRGSVIPLFILQRRNGRVSITDRRMTRFWITLEHGVRFVAECIERMYGGEVFIPKIPSMKVVDLAAVVAPGCEIDEIGIRPGEKLHEVLLSEHERSRGVEQDAHYIIQPPPEGRLTHCVHEGRPLDEDFVYASNDNSRQLNAEELRELLRGLPAMGL